MRARAGTKPKKKIEFNSYGTKENQTNTSRYRSEELIIPNDCKFRRTYYSNCSVCFMGRFQFGVKDQLLKLSNAFGVPTTTSFAKSTGIIVVDDLNRTNSVTIDRARRQGVVLLNEEEFLYLMSSNKTNTEITYEEK